MQNFLDCFPPLIRLALKLNLLVLITTIGVLLLSPELPVTDRSTRQGMLLVGLWYLNLKLLEISLGSFIVAFAYALRPSLHTEDNADPEVRRQELDKKLRDQFDAEDEEDAKILANRSSSHKTKHM